MSNEAHALLAHTIYVIARDAYLNSVNNNQINSAKLCLEDAKKLLEKNEYLNSVERAKKSIMYSQGLFSQSYELIRKLIEEYNNNIPKKKFKVEFTIKNYYEMIVEAQNEEEAEEIAENIIENDKNFEKYFKESDGIEIQFVNEMDV